MRNDPIDLSHDFPRVKVFAGSDKKDPYYIMVLKCTNMPPWLNMLPRANIYLDIYPGEVVLGGSRPLSHLLVSVKSVRPHTIYCMVDKSSDVLKGSGTLSRKFKMT